VVLLLFSFVQLRKKKANLMAAESNNKVNNLPVFFAIKLLVSFPALFCR